MESIPISVQGLEKMRKKLEALKNERPGVIQAIKEAREEGDLKENAGYHGARERQGIIEAQINYIESRIPVYDVIDLNTLDGDSIAFGATVELEDMETGDTKVYTLLGPDETDVSNGSISVHSPVAMALIGKMEGDEVVVDIPRGRVEYEIISVEYKGYTSEG